MEGVEIELERKEGQEAINDIVLSSIGWVTVNSIAEKLRFKAFTPQARGITTRIPLLPFAIKYKGRRIGGESFYKVKTLRFEMDAQELKQKKMRQKRKWKK